MSHYCIFLGRPLPDCHCVQMNSSKIPLASYYCQNNFLECRIFKRICELNGAFHLSNRKDQLYGQ